MTGTSVATSPADPKRAFRIGEVFSLCFSLLKNHTASVGGLILLFAVPLGLMDHLTNSDSPDSGMSDLMSGLQDIMTGLVYILLVGLLSASLTSATYRSLQGRPVSLAACLREAIQRFWPVIGVSLLLVAALMVGFLLLVIPGLIVMTWFFVAVPAVVIEGKGVLAGLRRSRELTKGSRWPVLGVAVILLLFEFASEGLNSLFAFAAGGGAAALSGLIVALVTGVIGYTLGTILPAAVYFKLRMAKEGVDAKEIAAVFD